MYVAGKMFGYGFLPIIYLKGQSSCKVCTRYPLLFPYDPYESMSIRNFSADTRTILPLWCGSGSGSGSCCSSKLCESATTVVQTSLAPFWASIVSVHGSARLLLTLFSSWFWPGFRSGFWLWCGSGSGFSLVPAFPKWWRILANPSPQH